MFYDFNNSSKPQTSYSRTHNNFFNGPHPASRESVLATRSGSRNHKIRGEGGGGTSEIVPTVSNAQATDNIDKRSNANAATNNYRRELRQPRERSQKSNKRAASKTKRKLSNLASDSEYYQIE